MSDLDDLARAARQESASFRPSRRPVSGPGGGFWVFVIVIVALVGAPIGYSAWRDHRRTLLHDYDNRAWKLRVDAGPNDPEVRELERRAAELRADGVE